MTLLGKGRSSFRTSLNFAVEMKQRQFVYDSALNCVFVIIQ